MQSRVLLAQTAIRYACRRPGLQAVRRRPCRPSRAALLGLTMQSSVTNAPFNPLCQKALRKVAQERKYNSKYWLTLPQSRRTCNAVVLPGESATHIYQHVEHVVPMRALPKAMQRRIVDEHPPFFASGVGILSQRKKWRAVTAERLIRLLNPTEEDRALFIDVAIAAELGVKYNAKDVIDVREASSVTLFNAEQLDDPYKGEPQRGVALNAVTGKRFGQPAHDILLGVGILRGYTSPMWVAERQMKHLNLELRRGAEVEGVWAPTMTGCITSLSNVPVACQRELLQELHDTQPHAFGYDVFFIYNVNHWEATRSRVLVKHMASINDPTYPYHFVNLHDLRLQKPRYASFVHDFVRLKMPLGVEGLQMLLSQRQEAAEEEEEEEGERNTGASSAATMTRRGGGGGVLAVQGAMRPNAVKYFFAEDATLRHYYNAACMIKPYLTVPAARPIAIVNGRLLGRRDESLLRSFALAHKLSSPIWLTEHAAHRLGVGIPGVHQKKYALIGAAAAAAHDLGEDIDDEVADGFYNLEDFRDPNEILSLFPKVSKHVHFLLDSKWRPVLGKQRQDYLTSLRRRVPLWVSVNECLMSGFQPLHGKKPTKFPRQKSQQRATGVRLYNSQYTSDPVRVIGLSTMYMRPQGLSV